MTRQHAVLQGILESFRSEELEEGGDDIEVKEKNGRHVAQPRAPWKTGGMEELCAAYEKLRKKKKK